MPLAILYHTMGRVSNQKQDFIAMIRDAWDSTYAGTIPTIGNTMDYRSIDLANNEYVLIEEVGLRDNAYGLGGRDYRKDIQVAIIIKTGVSYARACQLLEGCKRIFRNKDNWGAGYQNIIVSRAVNLSDRERKIFSYGITVNCLRVETVGKYYRYTE
jgi:hypothetical protein